MFSTQHEFTQSNIGGSGKSRQGRESYLRRADQGFPSLQQVPYDPRLPPEILVSHGCFELIRQKGIVTCGYTLPGQASGK
jgi:hypothetical protein